MGNMVDDQRERLSRNETGSLYEIPISQRNLIIFTNIARFSSLTQMDCAHLKREQT